MACDAIARLYDVDEDSVVFEKLARTKSYDQGIYTFRARKGKLIDLEKLHESVWATRLSGGTRSGLMYLDVTSIGHVTANPDGLHLEVANSDEQFMLLKDSESTPKDVWAAVEAAAKSGKGVLQVTGRLEDYSGRWPGLLGERPQKPRRLVVTKIQPSSGD